MTFRDTNSTRNALTLYLTELHASIIPHQLLLNENKSLANQIFIT